ncbi:MAG: hypothetical protein ACRC50_07390 [Gaiella sp.]
MRVDAAVAARVERVAHVSTMNTFGTLAGSSSTRPSKALGTPPNLRAAISVSDGVTSWGSAAKAERELGLRPRSLADGMAALAAARAASG